VQGRGKHCSTQTSCHRRNTKWCAFSRAQSGVHCSVCTYVTWHPISVPPTPPPHPQCAGLASQLAGREPSLAYFLLVNRLGCPGSTLGRGIPFLDCLLFSRLRCPGSTLVKGIPFPNCLLLFSRLGCPGSTPGRGIRSLTAY
jgi:hypothetical protein